MGLSKSKPVRKLIRRLKLREFKFNRLFEEEQKTTSSNRIALVIGHDKSLDHGQLEKMGLGRGVDATKTTLWRNVSNVQVRDVNTDSVEVITAESQDSKMEDYHGNIPSKTHLHKRILSLSCVRIEYIADSAILRKVVESMRLSGTRQLTKIASFYRLPADHPEDPENFETELASWILQRIHNRQQSRANDDDDGTLTLSEYQNPVIKLAAYLKTIQSDPEKLKDIQTDCSVFVRNGIDNSGGITHYIHALEIGEVRFELEESGKFERISGVIAFKIDSIHRAIYHLPYIRNAMHAALKEYIREKQNRNEGPYLISCGDNEKIYWKVNDKNELVGSTEKSDASHLWLAPTTDEDHPYEFSIAYISGESEDLESDTTECYLRTKVNPQSGSKALQLMEYVKNKHARLVLVRGDQDKKPQDIGAWETGGLFYLKVSRKRKTQYVAMKKTDSFYISARVQNKAEHRKPHTWMQFRLEKPEVANETLEYTTKIEETPIFQSALRSPSLAQQNFSTNQKDHRVTPTGSHNNKQFVEVEIHDTY